MAEGEQRKEEGSNKNCRSEPEIDQGQEQPHRKEGKDVNIWVEGGENRWEVEDVSVERTSPLEGGGHNSLHSCFPHPHLSLFQLLALVVSVQKRILWREACPDQTCGGVFWIRGCSSAVFKKTSSSLRIFVGKTWKVYMRYRYQTPLGFFFIVFLLTFLLVSQVKRAELPVGILKLLSPWFCSWLNGDEFQVEDKQLCLVNSRPCVEKTLRVFFFFSNLSQGKFPMGEEGRVKSMLERATSDDSENVIF